MYHAAEIVKLLLDVEFSSRFFEWLISSVATVDTSNRRVRGKSGVRIMSQIKKEKKGALEGAIMQKGMFIRVDSKPCQ